MPTKPPHHVSSQPFRISGLSQILTFGFRISPDLWGRITRNEPKTKSRTPQACIHQFNPPVPPGGTPNNPKKNETNPISAYQASPPTPKMRNEPNLTHGGPAEDQKCETNPITTYRWRLAGLPIPKYAKRTQSQLLASPIMRNEPNPCSRCHPERQAAERSAAAQSRGICQNTIAGGDSKQTMPHDPKMRNKPNLPPHASPAAPAHPQKMQNEPNFHRFRITPRPDYAKRTQFQPQPPDPRTKCAKQTQFSHAKCSAPHQKCETNPISVETPNLHSTIYNIQSLGPITRPAPCNQIPLVVFRQAFWAPLVH